MYSFHCFPNSLKQDVTINKEISKSKMLFSVAALFDYQRENTRFHHLVHIFILKEYGYDIYGNFSNLWVLAKLQMECKQMQGINPLTGP